jgi:hypothetical protein
MSFPRRREPSEGENAHVLGAPQRLDVRLSRAVGMTIAAFFASSRAQQFVTMKKIRDACTRDDALRLF